MEPETSLQTYNEVMLPHGLQFLKKQEKVYFPFKKKKNVASSPDLKNATLYSKTCLTALSTIKLAQ